ncbi:MAG TPA: YraN family protein [Bryobacteraceae bacterium]|jgi:putative endonuclease
MMGAALDYLRHLRRRQEWSPAQATGRRGEDLAHRFLRRNGYVIVARNYRLAAGDGEADLIAWDGEALAIVEVKTRESAAYGPPERAIGEEKVRHMRRVAREYTSKTSTPWEQVRFDVVTVLLTDPPEIILSRAAHRP